MPQFFFHVRTVKELIVDPDGSEMANLTAARREALVALRQILADRLRRGDSPLDVQQIEVADKAGQTLALVLVQDALGKMH